MVLSNFAVVHARADEMFGDPLVHCHTDKQLVLSYVAREALEDYFRIAGEDRRTLRQWNLVVERNLEAFGRIITKKYERDEWAVHNAHGQSYPRITITLQDMQDCGEKFSDDVLKLDANYRPKPA
ncbi:MAG: hypothetical protein WAM62_15135 [Pseudolabrys sp.]